MKYWEIITDNLKQRGWSLGYVSAIDSQGRTIWIVDAHRDGQRFIVRADEKLTAFLELEAAICRSGEKCPGLATREKPWRPCALAALDGRSSFMAPELGKCCVASQPCRRRPTGSISRHPDPPLVRACQNALPPDCSAELRLHLHDLIWIPG
jgi:hypothetical protein